MELNLDNSIPYNGIENQNFENYEYSGQIDAVNSIQFFNDLNKYAFQKFLCRNITYQEMKYDLVTSICIGILDANRKRNLELLSCAYKFLYQGDHQFEFEVIRTYSLEEFEQRYKEYQLKG